MPELAEVKLMSDFINETNKKVFGFWGIGINPTTKIKTDMSVFDSYTKSNAKFFINAETRGKELKVTFTNADGNRISPSDNADLYFSMGMSGNWGFIKSKGDLVESLKTLSSEKHIKLMFPCQFGILVMYDVRNFAKWRWANNWSDKRGPDPLTQFENFKTHIENEIENPRKTKLSNKPLNEILMDQNYFNGIGNYLRAEILYRLDINPFQSLSQISVDKLIELLQLCHDIPGLAYKKGGGTKYSTIVKESGELIKCYARKDKEDIHNVIDGSGRRFWYHKKWDEYIPQ